MTSIKVTIQEDVYNILRQIRDDLKFRSFTATIAYLLDQTTVYQTEFERLVKRVEKLEKEASLRFS